MEDKMKSWINSEISRALTEKREATEKAKSLTETAEHYLNEASACESLIRELEDRINHLVAWMNNG